MHKISFLKTCQQLTALVKVLLVLALAERDAGTLAGAVTIDIEDKVRQALQVNEAVGDSPLLVGVVLSLASPLDKASSSLQATLSGIENQASPTVNDVTVLEAPELELQEGVLLGRGFKLLVIELEVSTGLGVVLEEAVLNVKDMVRGLGLDVEPSVDWELDMGRDFGNLETLFVGGRAADGSRVLQPGGLGEFKGPGVDSGLALDQLDTGAILVRLDIDDKLGVVQQLDVAVNDVPELVVLTVLLSSGLVLLDQLDADDSRATIDIDDVAGPAVEEVAILESPQLPLQKALVGIVKRTLLLHGNVGTNVGGGGDPASLQIHDQTSGAGLDEKPVALGDGDDLGRYSGLLGDGPGDVALVLEPLERSELEDPLLIRVVLGLGALERKARASLGAVTLNVDGEGGLTLNNQNTINRLPALVVSFLSLLGDTLHQTGTITDNTLLAVENEARASVDNLTGIVPPELGLDLGVVGIRVIVDLGAHVDKDVRIHGVRQEALFDIDNKTRRF